MNGRPAVRTKQGPNWVWHLVLAMAVLLAQVTLARHSLQHLKKVDVDPAHAVCVECLALHAADHLGTAPALPAVAQAAPDRATLPHWVASWRLANAPRPYQSRAPPVFSV